jgi:hypothetical protein
MKTNVPQFIDIEDKIAFQLTAKQLGWFALGGVLIFFAWTFFDNSSFIAWSIIIVLLSSAFAFYRPAGISLVEFIKFGFLHIIRPKIYVWRIEDAGAGPEQKLETNKKSKEKDRKKGKKSKELEDLDEIIEMLDSQGF